VAPARFFTVRFQVPGTVRAPVEKPVPLETVPTPWSTVPAPCEKTGVIVVFPPRGTGLRVAFRLVATGASTTVMVAVDVLDESAELVAMMV
jgi:hypothetical protein